MKKIVLTFTLLTALALLCILFPSAAYAREKNAFALDCGSYTDCAGTKHRVTAVMDAAAVPSVSSSDASVASASLSGKTGENVCGFEIHANAVGSAVITVSDGSASRDIHVTVTERKPLVLDTSGYTTAVGNTYFFLAKSGTDDFAVPAPVTADPSVAKVEFAEKTGTGSYLFRVSALKSGTTTVGAELCGTATTFSVSVADTANLPFQPLLQKPELLSGCEITALTNLLNHDGYYVSKTYMADSMLSKDASKVIKNGKLYMADPAKIFVGDPRTPQFGCFSQPIADAANRYLKSVNSLLTAQNISGAEPAALYHSVANQVPVLAWVTMGMEEPLFNKKWIDKDTGAQITWIGKEHCVVLTGFTGSTVTFSDPLRGMVTCDRSLFEKRYAQVGKQAVVLR